MSVGSFLPICPLDRPHKVGVVKLYSRTDSCGDEECKDRLHNFDIVLSDEPLAVDSAGVLRGGGGAGGKGATHYCARGLTFKSGASPLGGGSGEVQMVRGGSMSVKCKRQEDSEHKWSYVTVVIPPSDETAKKGAVLSLCEVMVLPPDATPSLGSQRDALSDTQRACKHHHCIGCDPACERCGVHGCEQCVDKGRAFQLRDQSEWATHTPCQFML
jgi:hypothetical protein